MEDRENGKKKRSLYFKISTHVFIVGALLLGMMEILIVFFLPGLTGYKDAFAFIALVVILLWKPTGILGEKIAEKV